MPTLSNVTPLFLGQPVLGAYPPLSAAIFVGSAAKADAWLGNPAGTTQYGPCEAPGGALAVSGVLTGATTSAVAAAQAALQAMAKNPGPLLVPTGLGFAGWDQWTGCWFGPTDIVFGPVAASASGYQVSYRVIFRRSGTLASSGCLATIRTPGTCGQNVGHGPGYRA
jgi:hypothetical protein